MRYSAHTSCPAAADTSDVRPATCHPIMELSQEDACAVGGGVKIVYKEKANGTIVFKYKD